MFYEEFILEKVPEPFAESREIIFDINDGFLKQKLQDGTYQKLFHWQTGRYKVEFESVAFYFF